MTGNKRKSGVAPHSKVEFEKDNRATPETIGEGESQTETTPTTQNTTTGSLREKFRYDKLNENQIKYFSDIFNLHEKTAHIKIFNEIRDRAYTLNKWPKFKRLWPFILNAKRENSFYHLQLHFPKTIAIKTLETWYGNDLDQTGVYEETNLNHITHIKKSLEIQPLTEFFEEFEGLEDVNGIYLASHANNPYLPLLTIKSIPERLLLLDIIKQECKLLGNPKERTSAAYKPLTFKHILNYTRREYKLNEAKDIWRIYQQEVK